MITPMRIKRVMREMTQMDVSLRADLPQWKVSLFERGVCPRSDEALRIAEVLGADVKDLFPALQEARQ